MRNEHLRYALEIRDWGFIPEYEAWESSKNSSAWEVGKSKDVSWKKIIEAADLVGRAKETKFITNLKSQNETIRYWATIGLGAFKKPLSNSTLSNLKIALNDSSPSVRIEAANALIRNGKSKPALSTLKKELEHKNLIVVAHAARTVELLGEKAKGVVLAMEACLKRAYAVRPPDLSPVIVLSGDQDMAMFVGFSCNAFLQKIK